MSTANLPTEGNGDDYVIVLNGDPMDWWDAGGRGDREGYVMGRDELDGREVRVTVAYGSGGVSGASMYFPDTDEDHSLIEGWEESDDYLEFYADDIPEVSACVEILPESEIDTEQHAAKMSVANARSLLSDFEDLSVEEQHGSLMHAIDELRNAKRHLPEDY